MKLEKIQCMSITEGHSEEFFNPEDSNDVKRIMKFIKDKIDEGYYFYAAKKGGDYYAVHDSKLIKEEELERFLLAKHATKRLITPPVAGG